MRQHLRRKQSRVRGPPRRLPPLVRREGPQQLTLPSLNGSMRQSSCRAARRAKQHECDHAVRRRVNKRWTRWTYIPVCIHVLLLLYYEMHLCYTCRCCIGTAGTCSMFSLRYVIDVQCSMFNQTNEQNVAQLAPQLHYLPHECPD